MQALTPKKNSPKAELILRCSGKATVVGFFLLQLFQEKTAANGRRVLWCALQWQSCDAGGYSKDVCEVGDDAVVIGQALEAKGKK